MRVLDVDFVTWAILGHSQWLLWPHASHSPTFAASITSSFYPPDNSKQWFNSVGLHERLIGAIVAGH